MSATDLQRCTKRKVTQKMSFDMRDEIGEVRVWRTAVFHAIIISNHFHADAVCERASFCPSHTADVMHCRLLPRLTKRRGTQSASPATFPLLSEAAELFRSDRILRPTADAKHSSRRTRPLGPSQARSSWSPIYPSFSRVRARVGIDLHDFLLRPSRRWQTWTAVEPCSSHAQQAQSRRTRSWPCSATERTPLRTWRHATMQKQRQSRRARPRCGACSSTASMAPLPADSSPV